MAGDFSPVAMFLQKHPHYNFCGSSQKAIKMTQQLSISFSPSWNQTDEMNRVAEVELMNMFKAVFF